MPVYKRCSRCHKRIPSGTECDCTKKRHQEYDRMSRDKEADAFYHSAEWKRARDEAVARYQGINIYGYYINELIEAGTVVHHIIPLKDDWSKRINPFNLILLSESDHQKIHDRMRNGEYEDVIKELKDLVVKFHSEAY